MSTVRTLAALGAGLALLGLAGTAPAADKPSPAGQKPAANAAKPAAPAQSKPAVDPDALQALNKMTTYLGTLQNFELVTQTTRDLVTEDGQRIQLDGAVDYKVRRPAGFVIEVDSNDRKRTFYYDGKQFTLFAPQLGYYATVAAPATNLQVLDRISDTYGIELPLEDLFRWNDPNNPHREALTSGFHVGPATIDGVQTEQYAFRGPRADWQIWIEKGDRPLPRKLMIVDRSDPAMPAYTARLNWKLNPTFADADFTFKPGPDAKPIKLTAANQ